LNHMSLFFVRCIAVELQLSARALLSVPSAGDEHPALRLQSLNGMSLLGQRRGCTTHTRKLGFDTRRKPFIMFKCTYLLGEIK